MISNILKITNTKKLLILITTVCLLLVLSFALSFNNNNRKEIKRLEKSNKEIQIERNSLKINNLKLKNDVLKIESNIEKRKKTIDSLTIILSEKDFEIKLINIKIYTDQKEVNKTKMNIDYLKKNPIKRTGDELLNSINEKTKK